MADVRDPRLAQLARVSDSRKVVAATLEVTDLTKLVRGAKRGEGLGNELLAHMRTTDAVLLVVRCFEDDQVPHSEGRVDPVDDAETVELELVFADQAVVERRLQRIVKTAKSGDKAAVAEQEQLERLAAALEQGRPVRAFGEKLPDTLDLLTAKPALYIANVDESGNAEGVERLRQFGSERGIETISIADVNDLAPVVAKAQGRTELVIVMDDNVQPESYWPCFQAIASRFLGTS